MSIHEKMGPDPNDELERAAFGEHRGGGPKDLPPSSPHRLDATDHRVRLEVAARDVEKVCENLQVVLADPTVRGIPRDQLTLAAVEMRRNVGRIRNSLDGTPKVR